MTIRFDHAWRNGLGAARQISTHGTDVWLLRDVLGRVSMIVDEIPESFDSEAFAEGLGKFRTENPILPLAEIFSPESLLSGPSVHLLIEADKDQGTGSLTILDRTIVGSQWLTPEEPHTRATRVALYGFKGGVGRSTALTMLARRLANEGKCVLVVDLDLESPGLSSLLKASQPSPDGIIDYLVEAAVENEAGLEMVSMVELGTVGNGEVWIASAEGSPSEERDYLAKLNRIYADLPGGHSFAARLGGAVRAAEIQVEERSRRVDVVLLDCRAGIHDIAAVALTQLADISLLFASDSPQNWLGYGALFKQWRDNLSIAELDLIRQRIKMVSAMTPARSSSDYIVNFADHSQSCFEAYLYDAESAVAVGEETSPDAETFNFSPSAMEAPHYPLPILFQLDLVALNVNENPNWHSQPLLEAAYGAFLDGVVELIQGGSE